MAARIAAEPDPTGRAEIRRNLMAYEPVIDGDVLTARPIDRLAGGTGTNHDVLIGSNADEHALFLIPSGLIDFINDDRLNAARPWLVRTREPSPPPIGRLPDASTGELLRAAVTDWF